MAKISRIIRVTDEYGKLLNNEVKENGDQLAISIPFENRTLSGEVNYECPNFPVDHLTTDQGEQGFWGINCIQCPFNDRCNSYDRLTRPALISLGRKLAEEGLLYYKQYEGTLIPTVSQEKGLFSSFKPYSNSAVGTSMTFEHADGHGGEIKQVINVLPNCNLLNFVVDQYRRKGTSYTGQTLIKGLNNIYSAVDSKACDACQGKNSCPNGISLTILSSGIDLLNASRREPNQQAF